MNDISKWALRMSRIGDYKRRQTANWLRAATLGQRLRMTEELLLMDDRPARRASSRLFVSLSRLLGK